MFNKLQKELSPRLDAIRGSVEQAMGPSAQSIRRAIEEHNASIDKQSKELALTTGKEPTQLAHLGADAADLTPVLQKISGWIVFSAISSMNGNVGQSNYCSANQMLDVQTFSMRQSN